MSSVAAAVLPSASVDLGPLPASQPVTVTLHLAPTADRAAALMQFLSDVQTPGSPSYKQWLTPAEFAQNFGGTDAQLAEVQSFANSYGLTVGTVSPSGLRISLTGSASQIEQAMAPAFHQVRMGNVEYFANTLAPVLSENLSAELTDIDGLSTVPASYPLSMTTGGTSSAASLSAVAQAVDNNTVRLISLSGAACIEDVSTAEASAMQMVLRQATAQGITVLAQSGCNGRGSAAYPAAFSEVTSVAVAPGITPATNPVLTEVRPAWQTAAGLPADGFRHEPDLTVTSLSALAQTMTTILAQQSTGADNSAPRLGNINATLYQIATAPKLYTQPDDAAAGTWESATGLGLVDLDKLPQFFPHAGGAATQTNLTLNPTSTTYGTPITFSVAVTSAGSPVSLSGTEYVTLSAVGPTISLSTNGQGSSTSSNTNPPSANTYSITAAYPGDGTYANSNSSAQSLTISPYPLKLSTSLPGTATFGQTFNLTVTAQGISTDMPGGTIYVTVFGNTYPQSLTGSSTPGIATATVTIPALLAGTNIPVQITCSSSASDPNYTCANSGLYGQQMTVAKATISQPTLTISPSTPAYGSATVLTATFPGASTTPYPYPSPTGSVSFTDTTTSQPTPTISGGTLSGSVATGNSTTISSTVNNSFTASYPGDSNYNASTATYSTTGTKISTTTTVGTLAHTTIVTGGQTTFSAMILLGQTNTNLPPTGTVQFYSNGTQIGTAVQISSGTGIGTGSITVTSPSITFQNAGTDAITATYSGDTNYATSTSTNSVTLTVGSKTATTTVLTANPSSLTAGETVTLTATVAPTTVVSGAPALSGTVTFYDNGTQLGAAVTLSGSIATYTGTLAGTNDTVTAVYSGDSNYLTSTGSLTVKTAPVTTSTSLSSNSSSVLAGANVILTASVADSPTTTNATPGTPSGTVTFYDTFNGQQVNLGTATLAASGPYLSIGQISTTGLLPGTHSIVALFGGSSAYLTSTSTALTINVYDYSVSFAPSSLTLQQGASASAVATVTAINGFAGQVVLSCTPPSGSEATCSFSPATISISGSSQLLITTTAAQARYTVEHAGMKRTAGGVAVAMLLFGFLLPGARRRRPVLLAFLVSALLIGSLGCTNLVNNNGSSSTSNNGTPLGTATFTITTSGTDGKTTETHDTQIQVTVQ